MQRFSTPILAVFLGLLVLLVLVVILLATRQPIQQAIAEKFASPSSNAAQGRRFDEGFGSLSDLVPPAKAVPGLSGGGDSADSEEVDHSAQYRDLSWLKSQPQDGYTLQVLGARSEDAVKDFIDGQQDPGQFSYFQSQQDGQPWFVVVMGNYGSREQALGVADTLDLGLGSRPFPKRFGAYVAEVLAQAQPAPAATSAAPAPVPTAPAAP